MGVVKAESPLAGKPLKLLYQQLEKYDFEVVAITRREHVILPHSETLLKPEDRVILIASPEVRKQLAAYIMPPRVPEAAEQAELATAPRRSAL